MDDLLQAALGQQFISSSVSAAAQRVKVRVFIEGVEIPAISCQVQGAPNSPLMASIQVPPLVEGTRLAPRSLVHAFFQDGFALSNPYAFAQNLPPNAVGVGPNGESITPTQQAASNASAPAVTYPNAVTPCGDCLSIYTNGQEYKLCFVGELHGFTYTKNPMSRSLVLQCAGLTNYWDVAQQAENTDLFGPGMKTLFSGTGHSLFTDFLETKGSQLTQIIMSGVCNTFPKMPKGIAAGVVRLIEAIGGCYTTPSSYSNGTQPKRFSGQNLFFSIAELRYHFCQMLAMIEQDPTSANILNMQGWGGMFDRMLSGMGSTVSMRAAITALSRIIFYECYEQPCPIYVPGSNGSVSGQLRKSLSEANPEWSVFFEYRSSALETITRVQEAMDDPVNNDASDQGAYDKLPATSTNYAERRDAGKQKAAYRDEWGSSLKSLANLLGRGITQFQALRMPEYLIARMGQVRTLVNEATWHINNWEPNAKNASSSSARVKERFTKALALLHDLENPVVSVTESAVATPARLGLVVIRPDIWFAAPPRCNVLFPDQYTQMSFQRSMMAEPTRILLKLNDEFFGEDELFDKYYFAPKGNKVKKSGTADLSSLFGTELMDHELFTGILPVFEKMGEFNVFSARSSKADSSLKKVNFAQRSVNFLYFKYRFQARQLQVEARFDPYVAVGFPGLVLDRYVDLDVATRLRTMRENAPRSADMDPTLPYFSKYTALELIGANFLGNFTNVVHQASYESGQATTSITCQYARQVEERTEFLGTHADDSKYTQRTGGPAKKSCTLVACFDQPKLYSIGPQGGTVTSVLAASDVAPAGSTLKFFYGGYKRGNENPDVDVPVLVSKKLSEYGSVVAGIIGGDPDRMITLVPYTVNEDVPSYKSEVKDLPMEELIRPGWYGDIWNPSKISAAYDTLLGTTAITDSTQIHQQDDSTLDNSTSVLEMEGNCTIEQAVEFLVQSYSYAKQSGADIDQFIRSYVYRETASLIDMFGTADLQYDVDGHSVVSGAEGFHSRAFGQYENLFGLVTDDIDDVLDIKRIGNGRALADTRKRKQDLVLAYATALRASRILLG